MADTFLEFMLGPFRAISDFYFDNQLILNSVVIGIALYQIFFRKKKTENKSAN